MGSISGNSIADEAWRRYVREPLSGSDDFFASGGYSMSLLRMAAWIKDESGQDLVLGAFLDEPTLDGLARCLNGGASPAGGEGPEAGVHIQEFGEGDRTIVCIPGSYGRALAFGRLADSLNARLDEPVRLRCYELWNAVETSGVEGAIESVRARLRVDLASPGVLGLAGYSLGGLFAFTEPFGADAASKQLWMLDCYPPIPVRSTRAKLASAAANALAAPWTVPGSVVVSFAERARNARRKSGNDPDAASDHPARWHLLKLLSGIAHHSWPGEATLITLKRKPLWTPFYAPRLMNGLRDLLGPDARRAAVPGSHNAMLSSGVDGVARAMAEDLRGSLV